MIEFNGYLTGASEKFFFKKYVTYMQNAFIFGLVMVLPLIFMLMRIFQTFSIFYGYCAVFAYAMIAVRIKTPKGRKAETLFVKKICSHKELSKNLKNCSTVR